MFICLNVFMILVVGILSFDSSSFIEGIWIMALAPMASTISGATFHPFAMILLMSGWYFVVFLSLDSSINMSLQYIYGVGVFGGG
jgi:ABC-type amino acid transport system permease subunit